LQRQELLELAEWLSTGKADFDWFDFKGLKIPKGEAKRRLEILGVPHEASVMGEVLIHGEWAKALCECLCLIEDKKISARKFKEVFEANPEMDALELVNLVSGFEVKKKAGVFVGASMGRPEKSRERKMEPPVNSLFPVGNAGGRMRSVPKAAGERVVEAELCVRSCPKCGLKNFLGKCECGSRTDLARECEKCCKVSKNEKCECGGETKQTSQRQVALQTLFERACERTNERPKEVKAVIGLISREKVPESLEKGILRAKHDLSVFRDGTIRFDSTEIPATHFTPEEIGVSVAELRELGYDKDFEGRELLSPGQTVELKVQDAIISRDNADYFVKIAKFVDDELVYYYGEKPFYNCENTRDVLGKQCIAIAPHTSAGILCRVIGFTDAYGIVAHPYLHCATRRNCDGDELALILLMDGLLNFSRHFLPETRGGQMDAPLVLTTVMDPREVDDEAHAMDSAFSYPLEFYEATLKRANPSEAKVETISSRLGTERQFSGIGFTHKAKFKGPLRSRYLEFKSMPEKVEEEITLMKKIRAVDYKDATERIISSHFFPDLYGNLRKFGKQKFRCVDCNVKYRRVPLAGKCSKCNGKLLLTVNKGGIEKYLSISKELVERFQLPDYLRQRLMLLEKEIKSVFEDEKSKQFSLADFA
jgi:DNA polymerase II large subunit